MNMNELLNELGRVLSVDETRLVLAALRRDALIWQSLEQVAFVRTLVDRAPGDPQPAGLADNKAGYWLPGRLALAALGEALPFELLRGDPMAPIGQSLQEKAVQLYQAVQRTGRAPSSLREAGLLALALRERRRLTGSWNGLLNELLPKYASEKNEAPADQPPAWRGIWRTALACLYSLVPDPEEMLRALAQPRPLPGQRALHSMSPSNSPYAWIAHAVLCQPGDDESHAQILRGVMQGLPVSSQLALLRGLSLSGSEALAGTLANRMLIGHPAFSSLRMSPEAGEPDLSGLASRALALQQMGAFYQLAGDHSQALSLYGMAETTLEQWLAGLAVQRMNLQTGVPAGLEGEVLLHTGRLAADAKYLAVMDMAASSGWLKDDLGAVLVSHPRAAVVLEQAPSDVDSPFLQLKRALLMANQQPALARDLAREGAAGLLEEVSQNGIPFPGEFVYSWVPNEAPRILLDLDLADEALALTRALLETRPVDWQLLQLAAVICERLGRLEQAVEYVENGVALAPDDPSGRRMLAHLLGQAGRWKRSYAAWKDLLALNNSGNIADRLACAKAALRADLASEAVALARGVLETEPNSGVAQGLVGLGLAAQGDTQQAAAHLVQATLLAPEILEPWLGLARIQQDEPQRALETLRAAVTAVPEAAEGHQALGQACLAAGLLAEALPHLKKAFQLLPDSGELALQYGRTLRALGHPSEARIVLERVRSHWNSSPELAYEYAQVMLDLNQAEAALPVLEMALRNGLPVLDGYLLYARVLMGEYRTGEDAWDADVIKSRLQQASAALSRILEADPNNLEARFLMADILREKGDLDAAFQMYWALANLDGTRPIDLRWRVQWGLGRTALRLGQIDIALAAFQEACLVKPDHLALQRGLAEASQRASLVNEALSAANDALHLAPDDIENLDWYAGFVAGLGEVRRAVSALERAVQLDSHQPDLLVSLAHWQLSAGDLAGARASLENLLLMEKVGRAVLWRAAHIYLRLGDPQAALLCYEHALAAGTDLPGDLLFEIAQLHETLGNLDTALELSQRTLDEPSAGLEVYLFQSDLLVRLNRQQAALVVLERAQRVAQTTSVDENGQGEICERYARLMLQENNLPAALHHAEKVLALRSEQPALRYRAADLAMALLQSERADRFLEPVMAQHPAALLDHGPEGTDLFCLAVENVLARTPRGEALDELAGRVETALAKMNREGFQAPGRLLALRARLLARAGRLREASSAYTAAVQAHGSAPAGLWLAEATFDCGKWQAALDLLTVYAQEHPFEARAALSLARGLVLSAERQRVCEDLDCRVNAPGSQSLSEESRCMFDEAIQAAGRLANNAEIGRWRVRGQAAFALTPGALALSARALAALPSTPEDTAALVAVLRQLDNRAAALQVAHRHEEDAGVLLEVVICYQKEPSTEGLEVAERAVAIDPGQPLVHAARAVLEQGAGNLVEALESYENALAIWPDETGWHDAAGSLCLQSGQAARGLSHRRKALELEPHNARLAYKLGQACLADGDVAGAITSLERSCAEDAQQADAWLCLATAYHMAERLPEALEAANQASKLDPVSAESLLVAGDIALAMQRSDLALGFGQDALRREPENAGAALFLCNVYEMSGRAEEGLAVLEGAAPAVKAVLPVAFERAKLIRRLHGAQAALETLEKLAREHPEEPGLLGYLARTQAECGEIKAAERSAFKALRLDPYQPDLTLMLGRLQRKSGQLDQAVHLLSEAIRMEPDNLEAYLELGEVYQQRREFSLALQIYRQAMRVAPGDFEAFYQSGLILRDGKDYSNAESMLRKAAELAPDNLTIRRQLVGVIALNLVHQSKQEVTL